MHKNYFATNYYVYGTFVHVCILHLYCFIICSSLSELDDTYHTNEMVVYHKATQSIVCVDLTTPLSHDPIRCSINVRELMQRVTL